MGVPAKSFTSLKPVCPRCGHETDINHVDVCPARNGRITRVPLPRPYHVPHPPKPHRPLPRFRPPFDICQKLPYPAQPKPPVMVERVPMTIAAGFECNDGIVLATDLEITEAMIKRTGGKSTFITSSGKAVAIAGSGFYDVVAYACEVLGEKKIAEGSFTDIVDNLRRGLDGIYRDHICLSYDPSEWDKVLQLLIGIVVDEGDDGFSSGLYVSSRSILRKTGPYDFIGYGRDLAFYVMQSRWTFTTKKGNLQPMNWKEHMFLPSVDKAIPLAKKVMEDVTENVPYCGHGVTILKVTSDGDASYVNP